MGADKQLHLNHMLDGCLDWKALAASLAARIPMEALHPRAVAELRKTAHASAAEPLGIACSGGADSIGLLLLLFAHFPELRPRFCVLHFDHKIRAGESAEDARFVAETALSLGIRFQKAEWEAATPDASEEAARNARMSFLHSQSKILLFGHNKTDIAETLLLRLGRGSSLDGLSGPRPVQRFRKAPYLHLRPLLKLRGDEIRGALSACDIPWREDATNAGTKYTRNKLRHDVLPQLEAALGRDWISGAARSRERIEEADDALGHEADEILSATNEDPSELHLSLLSNTNPAVARRILERWMETNALRATAPAASLDRLLAAAHEGRYPKDLNIPGITIGEETLRKAAPSHPATPDWGPLTATENCEIHLPDDAILKIQYLKIPAGDAPKLIAELRRNASLSDVILTAPHAPLTIRQRREGDAYKPLGAPGKAKIHDMQINRKIPASERATLPVVLEVDHILWSAQLPPADEYKLTEGTTRAVRLTYRNNSSASDSYKRNAD